MKTAFSPAFVLACLLGLVAAEARTWTESTGQYKMEAELLDVRDGKAILKLVGGRTIAFAMDELCKQDQQYIRGEIIRRRAALQAEVSDKPTTIPYGPGRRLCTLANAMIDESSGLASSLRTKGLFWTHNDSGDSARIYAFDAKGKDIGSCRLKDVQAFDFEDMASFSMEGKPCLLIADTGNNGLAAAIQILYLIEEPPAELPSQVPVVQVINYSYEDDYRNCEALAVDPTSKTILLATKERDARCLVYALAWPKNDPKKVLAARRIATLKVPPVTAMDVSPDGRRAVLLTYNDAYEYTRAEKEDWAAAFSRRPSRIVLPKLVQGEAICYGSDGKTLYLTSEKLPTPLLQVPVR